VVVLVIVVVEVEDSSAAVEAGSLAVVDLSVEAVLVVVGYM